MVVRLLWFMQRLLEPVVTIFYLLNVAFLSFPLALTKATTKIYFAQSTLYGRTQKIVSWSINPSFFFCIFFFFGWKYINLHLAFTVLPSTWHMIVMNKINTEKKEEIKIHRERMRHGKNSPCHFSERMFIGANLLCFGFMVAPSQHASHAHLHIKKKTKCRYFCIARSSTIRFEKCKSKTNDDVNWVASVACSHSEHKSGIDVWTATPPLILTSQRSVVEQKTP